MRAEIEKVEVAWALLFGFTLFSMSFNFLFCNLNFLFLAPASEITLQFFSGTRFRSWTFWTYIVTIKYELYPNLGPLRSISRAPEHKMPGGGQNLPPPLSQVGLNMEKWLFVWNCFEQFNLGTFLFFPGLRHWWNHMEMICPYTALPLHMKISINLVVFIFKVFSNKLLVILESKYSEIQSTGKLIGANWSIQKTLLAT